MFDLLKRLKSYKAYNEEEENSRLETISFLEKSENCYSRTNLAGHVTAGAFVADDKGNILLNHHKKIGMWFQFGGHSDGNENSLEVAQREIMEETGIENYKLIGNDIFDINAVLVSYNSKKNEPEHMHYDVNFLFIVENHNFKISNESTEIKWVTIQEAKKLIDKLDVGMLRMVDKYEEYLSKQLAINT